MKNFIAFLLLLVTLPAASQNKDLDKKLKGLDAYIEQVRKDWKVPGLAVAIVYKDQVVYSKGFGNRDVEKNLPVTPETLFAIGSTTKAITAAGVCLLQEDGKVDLDKPVRDYLPTFTLQDSYASEKMTPRDLLSHRSGLPRHDLMWYGGSFSRREMFDKLRYLEPNKTFRERWEYQNLMFMTAGILIEDLTGKSWEEFTRENFLVPLEMNTTNFSVNQLAKSENGSLGYIELNDKVQAIPYRNIDAIAPAGSINSNVNEMSNWVITLINGGKFKGKNILGAQTIRQIQTPVTSTPVTLVPPQYDEVGYGTYGLGWTIYSYRGKLRVEHGGAIDGFSANVSFMPKDSVGVVVLTNKGGTPTTGIIRNSILDRMLGMSTVDWNGRALTDTKKAKEAQAIATKSKDEGRVKDTQPSHALTDYVGKFEHPAYGLAIIKMDGDSLTAEFHGMTTTLLHYHYDIFEGTGPRFFKGEKFIFGNTLTGDINELKIKLEPTVKEIVFTRKPDVDESTFSLYVGDYDFGGQPAKIYLRGETLVLFVTGQPEYELVPTKEHEFKIKIAEGFIVRFIIEDGKVTEMHSIQPNGTFKAKRK